MIRTTIATPISPPITPPAIAPALAPATGGGPVVGGVVTTKVSSIDRIAPPIELYHTAGNLGKGLIHQYLDKIAQNETPANYMLSADQPSKMLLLNVVVLYTSQNFAIN